MLKPAILTLIRQILTVAGTALLKGLCPSPRCGAGDRSAADPRVGNLVGR